MANPSGLRPRGGLLARLLRFVQRERAAEAGAQPVPPAALLDPGFLRQLESLSLATRGAATAGLIGEHASRRKASSVEFADYRGYVPGDDFRLIDWNVYARLGELCLKLTQARENVALHLLLDASQSMDWGEPSKFLYARQLAAALGVVALANYDSVVLTVLRDGEALRFPALRGKSGIYRLLGFLSTLEAGGATDLRKSAVAFCSHRGHGGVAVMLTDLWDARQSDGTARGEGYEDALRYLLRSGLQPTLVHVLDPQELEPQIEGALELIDCETGRPLSVVVTPALLARYRTALAAHMEALARFCLGLRVSYLPVRTTDPLESIMLDDLRRLAVVR